MGQADPSITLTVETTGALQTEALGHALGEMLTANLVIALYGPLGAGKTTLTKGIATGLGIAGRVTSPTFALVNEYDGRRGDVPGCRLIHVDPYRLGEAPEETLAEMETVGLSEMLAEIEETEGDRLTVLVIEWAERVAALLPDDYLEIRLAYAANATAAPDRRQITLAAHGPASAALLSALSSAPASGAQRDGMSGHGE